MKKNQVYSVNGDTVVRKHKDQSNLNAFNRENEEDKNRQNI